jgi:hypothetical protein
MTAHIEEVNDGNFAKIVLGSTGPVLAGPSGARHAAPWRQLLKRSPTSTEGARRL